MEESFLRKEQETQKINSNTFDVPKCLNLGTSCTTREVEQYTLLFKEFQVIFAWNYDDLREYFKSIFQHTIPLKEESKPFKQKLRVIDPKLNPSVKMELEKLKRDGIIFSIRH